MVTTKKLKPPQVRQRLLNATFALHDLVKIAHPTMPIVNGKADEKVVVHRLVLEEAGEEAAPFFAADLFPL